MNPMIRCVTLLAIAVPLLMPVTALTEETGEAAPHHIYLHVMPPKDGQPVHVFIVPPGEEPPVPAKALETPHVEPERTETRPAARARPDRPATRSAQQRAAQAAEEAAGEDAEVTVEQPVVPEDTAKEESDIPGIELVETVETIEPEKPEEERIAEGVPPPPPPTDSDRPTVPMGLLLFIFVLAIFLGFELISKVPSQLHTPLMSGSNAISGITIVGALAAAGLGMGGAFGTFLGFLAVVFAAINVVGGYLVTNRMLAMFKTKDGGAR